MVKVESSGRAGGRSCLEGMLAPEGMKNDRTSLAGDSESKIRARQSDQDPANRLAVS